MTSDKSPTLESADCLWAARRLQEVTTAVQFFFENQVVRLADSLETCEKAIDEGELVQNLMLKLKQEQGTWEIERNCEIQRLSEASKRLETEWARLESARREFMLQEAGRSGKNAASYATSRTGNGPTTGSEPSSMPRSSRDTLNMIESLRNEMHVHANKKH